MHKRPFALLAVTALVFSACGGATQSPNAATTAPESAAPPASEGPPSAPPSNAVDLTGTTYKPEAAGTTGGTVVMSEWQTISTMNPFYAAANADIEAAAPVFEALVDTAPDLKYVPEMVTKLPTVDNGGAVVNGDNMDVTWNLKPGMKWSDGQPITCADLEATWKWVIDKDQAGLYQGTTGFDQITSVDGGTGTDCVIHYKGIYGGYIGQFSNQTPVLPAHYLSTVPVKDAVKKLYPLSAPKTGVYSGPFIPDTIDPAAQITYIPNPNAATVYGHAPYLDKLIFKYYGDSAPMVQGFRAGEIDMAQDLSDSDVPQLTDIPDNQKKIQDQLFNESNYFNNKRFKEKFGDDYTTIIHAIMAAIDVKQVMAGPMNGTVTRATGFVAPQLWFYKKETVNTGNGDAAAAKQLLDAAGWVPGSDGIRAKNGKKLEIEYCTTTRQYRIDTITLIASQLNAIGIKADVKAYKSLPEVFGGWAQVPDDQDCNTQHGNFDVVMHGFTSNPDPTAPYLVYSSKGIPDAPPHQGGNEMRISIPEMDAAWETVVHTLDTTKIKDAYGVIQDIYASDKNTFEVPFFNHVNVWLLNPKLHNMVGNPSTAEADWNTEDWWIEK
ncbi:MAG TPA: ABC transporter substrate-binding protein [Candidatus Limnocylindrales bacterium]|jgi:peptide/nickel transport system substrate-binding protein